MTDGRLAPRVFEAARRPGTKPDSLTAAALAAMRVLTSRPDLVVPDVLNPVLTDTARATGAERAETLEVVGARTGTLRLIRRARWMSADRAVNGSDPELVPGEDFLLEWSAVFRQGGVLHGPLTAGNVAIAPVEVAGSWWGLLAVCRNPRAADWTDAELDGLRTVSAAIGALVAAGLASDRLTEFRNRYQTLVEQVPAIIYTDLPREDRTAYVSPQIEPILGVTPQEWLADPRIWHRMLHPDDRDVAVGQYREFVENRGPHLTEYRMVRPDGRVVWIRDRAQAVRDEQGRVILEQGLMMDVTELKEAEASAQRHAELLERVDSISRQLTELVLQGAGPSRILRTLARVAENPVVLEDAAHQLIDFAAYSAGVDDVLAAWATHSRVGHPDNPNGVLVHNDGHPRCAWLPLWIRGDLWGRLHLLEIDSPLKDADQFPLDRAAAAVSLALLSQRDAAHLSDYARSALISDIARGKVVAASEIYRRAAGLGAELSGRSLVGIVVELRATDIPEHERHRTRTLLLTECRRVLTDAGCTGLSGLEGDRVLMLSGLPRGRPARAVLDEVGTAIWAWSEKAADHTRVVIGFSRTSERPNFGRLLKEAMEAATFGVASADSAPVHHFRELGVHHLLVRLAEGPELSRFVEAELEPLLSYDVTSKSPLLPTLVAYLEHGGKMTAVARAMHLERRTVYYRVARIEKLLGRKLDDRETRLRCEVALRALSLLRQRSPVAGREPGQ